MRAIDHKDYNFYQRMHEEQGEMVVPTDGFSGYETLSALKGSVGLYLRALSKIRCINNIDWKRADKSYLKAVLNSSEITSKEQAMELAEEQIKKQEEGLFKELDKQINPYYILLCPKYYYTTLFEEKTSGYKKDFGVNELSMQACERYYKHKLSKS